MRFIGRKSEIEHLRDWENRTDGSYLSVIYGRRRIGKTRLVEEAFAQDELLVFEGVEGQPTSYQQAHFLDQLADISGRNEYRLIKTGKWTDLLVLLSKYIADHYGNRPVTVLFDEFPWMAAERTKLVSSLKYVWDRHFTKNNRLHLILCGSVCSFLVKKVVRSKALYGRVDLELRLGPLETKDIQGVFRPNRSLREITELYMAVGGVPKYLEMVDAKVSTHRNLAKMCFGSYGYLVEEFDRLFASHFGKNPVYKKIISHLALRAWSTRDQLSKVTDLASGGGLTECLEDLELAGFTERYNPVDTPNSQRIVRYRLTDPYLRFYFRFIEPSLGEIRSNKGQVAFTKYAPQSKYAVWCGLAFEHLCLRHHRLLAEELGFSSVRYRCGSWFPRKKDGANIQIDLLFYRDDRVITLCEIKFCDEPIGKAVIGEVEKKRIALPNPKQHTIETVLISASPATSALVREGYFNRIVGLDFLF